MSTNTAADARRSDLDALRAFAMLLGILLHGSLSFFGSFWVVTDSRQAPGLGLMFSALHGFRMPLFFVMSGFFSAMLLQRRGRGALVKHRFRRVFLPLLAGMLTIVPLTHAVSALVASSAPKAPESASPAGGASTIWAAADAGDLGAIEARLADGAAVDGRDGERGWTPLMWATFADRAEAVELLIRRGADPNAPARDGGTPLHAAAFVGHEKAAAALVENGANVNAADHRGATPLDNAMVDAESTLYYASILDLKATEDGLERRKQAVADHLREHGATAGRPTSVVELLMLIPIFSHLWFLWFLWWLVLGMAAVSALGAFLPAVRLPDRLVLSPARYLWLVPLTMIPQWFMGEGGEPSFFGPDTSTGPLPIPHVFAYYAIFFGFGAMYHGRDERSGGGGRWWPPLAIALLVVFPMGTALAGGWTGPVGAELAPTARRGLLVFLHAAYPWLMTFGLMGMFRRLHPAESPTMRYLSDSAYWLYLAHVPLVIAAQYAVRDWPIPAVVKLPLLVAATTAVLLWSYQTMVRYTWLGRFLNGPRERPARAVEAVA